MHTAPGHGADDFDTGMKYGLPMLNPVDAAGRFTAEAGPYAGLQIFDANAKIVEDLRASGALWSAGEYEHSYPHCWRCHNPGDLPRDRAVVHRDGSKRAAPAHDRRDRRGGRTFPSGDASASAQMIETHPEWCLSRQRTWGTPIPAVTCVCVRRSRCSIARVARLAAKRFAQTGADAWWSDPVETYLPAGFACPSCGGTRFEKEKNIVDIWFESGVTHLAVLGRDGMPWPATSCSKAAISTAAGSAAR